MFAVNTLRLANTNVFFGPGPQLLLAQIEATASLRKATIETGISYTKALRMLRKMEQELGFAVVASAKGGSTRGGTTLTPKGKQLLQTYTEVQHQLQAEAQRLVEERFAVLKE
ncbi:LysR family transcriptional regulator [Ruminococcaceae bacterium OttesenSCG-928-A16]|nr:LysR family transcriptional regulator [Ruminococcaceae bacterium OttesenSCG-928-A16]